MNMSLEGRIALVTGASGGLGRHFAETLAAQGAEVVLAARREEQLEEAAQAIQAAGGQAATAALDVTDPDSVAACFDAAETAFGTPDIIVNNAGIAGGRPAEQTSAAEWQRILDTNLSGCWHVATEAARRLIDAQTPGSIVNIASILGIRVQPHVAPYIASKSGLVNLTRALALEWARYGIRVNAVAPGYFETDINRAFFQTDAGQALIRRIPQRRLGRFEDLDGALLLLASDAGRYMTGAVIPVDGGHLNNTL